MSWKWVLILRCKHIWSLAERRDGEHPFCFGKLWAPSQEGPSGPDWGWVGKWGHISEGCLGTSKCQSEKNQRCTLLLCPFGDCVMQQLKVQNLKSDCPVLLIPFTCSLWPGLWPLLAVSAYAKDDDGNNNNTYLVGFIRSIKQACLLVCLSQHFLAYRQHYISVGYCCIYPYWHLSGHNKLFPWGDVSCHWRYLQRLRYIYTFIWERLVHWVGVHRFSVWSMCSITAAEGEGSLCPSRMTLDPIQPTVYPHHSG